MKNLRLPYISKWRRFNALGRGQKRLFWVATILLPWYWVGLRVLGYLRLYAWVARSGAGSAMRGDADIDISLLQEYGEAVNLAARHSLFPVTCLTRSMLLQSVLGRRGVCSDLRIGVQIKDGVFAAHAWVEYKGVPLNDRVDISQMYLPMPQDQAVGAVKEWT
jgi:hypothetical protein